jgi:hypothetical protein
MAAPKKKVEEVKKEEVKVVEEVKPVKNENLVSIE